MTDWASGYVADIEYLPGLYVEQAPNHLMLGALVNGFEPPFVSGPFTYCELGCGQGVTALVIAAANPQAEIIATDFNPAQIARARAMAKAAGLSNITFLELSFAEMLGRSDLPEFDMVTLHGVWSWIAPEDRHNITRFMRERVKPGGMVSVTYNAMPGWTALLPMQRLLLEHSRLGRERSDVQVMKGLEWIERLQAAGSGVLGNAALLDQLRKGSDKSGAPNRAVYLAHEYLNANWHPQYHMDTAAELAEAKLGFIGSASLIDNFPDLALKPEQRQLLEEVPAGPLRETLKDYLVSRPFRRDLYARGPRRIADGQRDAHLRTFGLALTIPPHEARTELDVPAGKAQLPDRFYKPLFAALAERPRSLDDLVALPELKDQPGAPSMVEIAGVLVGSGQAIAIPPQQLPRNDAAVRLNRLLAQEVAEQRAATAAIATPLTGSGLNLTTMEGAVFHALATGITPEHGALTDTIVNRLAASGTPLARDGNVITSPEGQREIVGESADWCLRIRVPLWEALGAL
ncbi:methyltransferase family protein [Azorhizobium sp. AG788]|uniref:class I SAM-dependent methyltransferase n=1 Tax=Azorhizobium sp. AG788 TaxID=2183897 RepID=UPI00105BCA80|nr:class I SAM-dependent methyltransferase [Azorhizobium sp. AG788]TDT99770.1 methyltransferase family protein [Azorhizobium sp. AG788]